MGLDFLDNINSTDGFAYLKKSIQQNIAYKF